MTAQMFPVNPTELEEVEKYLLVPQPAANPTNPPTPTKIPNPDTYLILPEHTHGGYSYPDLLVPVARTHLNENWEQCSERVAQEGSLMLTPRQYADFLSHLRSGKVHDGTGARVDSGRINALLDDILTVRDPYRAEWLDAKFSKSGLVRKSWSITYHKIKPDGTLERVTEPLHECLRDNKTPGIDLDYWLSHATTQGLPPKNNPSGSLYYWHPRDGAVVRFRAYFDRVRLDCDRNPQYSDGGLGVRAAKIKR